MTAIRCWGPPEFEAEHDPRIGTPPAPVCPDHLEQAEVRALLGRYIVKAMWACALHPEGSVERLEALADYDRLMVMREEWEGA